MFRGAVANSVDARKEGPGSLGFKYEAPQMSLPSYAVAIHAYEPEAGLPVDKYEAFLEELQSQLRRPPFVAVHVNRSEARSLMSKYEIGGTTHLQERICFAHHIPCPNLDCLNHVLNVDDITPSLAHLLDILDMVRRNSLTNFIEERTQNED